MHTLSEEGLELIKNFEGCRLTTYLDPVGIPTVGYGFTGKLLDGTIIALGVKITQEQADNELKDRLDKLSIRLDKALTREVNSNQFNALIAFSYNLGMGALERSSLFNYVQEGQWAPAAAAFMLYDKAKRPDGSVIVLKGLQERRKAESILFQKE